MLNVKCSKDIAHSTLHIIHLYSLWSIVSLSTCVSKSISLPPKPLAPQEVEQSINKLLDTSFEFSLNYLTPELKGDFNGIYSCKNVKLEGLWKFDSNERIEWIKAIGIGGKEYRCENNAWQQITRTRETQVANLLHTVCSIGQYKFKTIKDGFFIYEFSPNLLFMSPQLTESYGELWINISSQLPEKIIASGSLPNSVPITHDDYDVSWQFNTKNIGKEFKINNPLATIQSIELIVECSVPTPFRMETGQIASLPILHSTASILKIRFEFYGFTDVDYKLSNPVPYGNGAKDHIILYFRAESDKRLVKSLIQPGKLELYTFTYPTQPVYELKETKAKAFGYVRGDSTKPVLLKESLPHKLVASNFKYGELGLSIAELTFDKELPNNTRIAVVLDDEVLGIFHQVWGKTLKINADKETWLKIKHPLPYKVILKMTKSE